MKLTNIRAVIFDLDGTLLDTNEYILQAFEHTMRTHNLPKKSREEILNIFGPGLKQAYSLLWPEFNNETLFDTHTQFQINNLHLVKLFPEVKAILKTLQDKNVKIGAVTNRSSRSVKKSLEQVGIESFFDIIITFEDVTAGKPDPEGILKALDVLKVKPENALMVGDTYVDILAGHSAGVKTVGAAFGMRGEKIKEAKPDYVINDITELLTILGL